MAWYDKGIDFANPSRKGRYKRREIDLIKLETMYYDGAKIKKIAEEFTVSKATITRHLKFMVPDKFKRNKGRTSNQNSKFNSRIIKLYTNDHLSTEQIGQLMGCSSEKVRLHLKHCNIERRGKDFKNTLNFHPKNLNRKVKRYPFPDLESFNRAFTFLYCLNIEPKDIALRLKIYETTAVRRIRFLRIKHYFKIRSCRKCSRLFRFIVTDSRRNKHICPLCQDPRQWHDSIKVSRNFYINIRQAIKRGEIRAGEDPFRSIEI